MADVASPINDLRRAQAVLEASGDPACSRIAAGLQGYLADAGRVTVDRALGLSSSSGGGPWWTQEARERRDAGLRDIRRTFFGNAELAQAADEIERLARRRSVARTAPAGPKEVMIDAVLRTNVKFPKQQQLKSILRNPPP